MQGSTKKTLLLGAFTVIAVATSVFFLRSSFDGAGSASAQDGGMPAMPVPYITVAETPVQIWKEFSGRLTAVESAEIRPQVSGLIEKIHFVDGQIVKKGDLLYTIDPRPYEAAVAQAKAEVNSAWNDVQYAKKEMARAEELLKTGAISKQGYEQRTNQLKVNQSTVTAAAARVKAAEVDLDHTTIEAPIDGRISRAEITEGNLVSAAAAPLLTTIVSDANIYADFDVDEQTYIGFVRAKAGSNLSEEQMVPVRLMLNSDDKVYGGMIKSFDNRISVSSGTIRARAMFENEDGALLPGMFARVQIGSTDKENKIVIPEKAIQTDQSRKFVYVVGDDFTATYREVKPGEMIGKDRIILSGLMPNDRVIVDNLMKLRPGAKVQPMTEAELAAMKQQMAAQAQQAQGQQPQAGGDEAAAAAQPEAKAAEPAAVETEDDGETPPQPIPFEAEDDSATTEDTTAETPAQE